MLILFVPVGFVGHALIQRVPFAVDKFAVASVYVPLIVLFVVFGIVLFYVERS